MNKDLAQMVVNTAARAAMDVGNLMPLLKTHGAKADEPVRLAIASAVHELMMIADQVFKQHPDLQAAAEARLVRYQRSYY
jgi:hypothetical protein